MNESDRGGWGAGGWHEGRGARGAEGKKKGSEEKKESNLITGALFSRAAHFVSAVCFIYFKFSGIMRSQRYWGGARMRRRERTSRNERGKRGRAHEKWGVGTWHPPHHHTIPLLA